jgi:hypothetical protein
MSALKTKNDIAWETLFERHRILTEINRRGVYEISSEEINKVREARLATKFDYYVQLPELFKKNDLTIQPNTRGTYLIGRFESYQKLKDDPLIPIVGVSPTTRIKTIDPFNLYSESAVLLCAYHTGIISNLLSQDVLLTVFGRMSSGHFGYSIKNRQTGELHEIKVEGAQLEIDGGFEGESVFAIFEAKNQSVDDFLVRQLYYPYRLWSGKIGKRVVPIFMSYSNSNSVFSFYVFRFANENLYNSIELVMQRKYQIVPSGIELADIIKVLKRVKVKSEPEDVPFPQADNFDRIVDLLSQLYGVGEALSQEHITTNYAFDLRQTQYYTQAANYLGLVGKQQDDEQGVTYFLTKRGISIMAMPPQARNLALVECILERKVFNRTLRPYVERGERPTREQVVEIMKAARLGLTGTTIGRRAGTVLSWMDWIMRLTKERQQQLPLVS